MKIEVDSYGELEEFVDMFKSGKIDLLIVEGQGGFGKSHTVKRKMEGKTHLFMNTHATPLQTYTELYNYKNYPVVIDDIDNLLNNSKLVSIFKQAGETNDSKYLSWNSSQEIEVPKEFYTKSNICLICNRLKSNKDENTSAFYDRGFRLHFNPKMEEVLKKMEEVVQNSKSENAEEVLDFIKEKYSIAQETTLRCLIQGIQMADYGKENWREVLSQIMGLKTEFKVILDLYYNYDFNDVKTMVREYMRRTGKSRRDFYNKRNELIEKGIIEN